MATAIHSSRYVGLMVCVELAETWVIRRVRAHFVAASAGRRTRGGGDVIIAASEDRRAVRHSITGAAQRMQILQLLIIVIAVVAALVIAASGRRSIGPATLGPVIGLLAAFVVLVRTTDLMPDLVEDELGDLVVLVLVVAAASGLVALSVHLSRRE